MAGHTKERALRFSITFINATAYGAGTGGVFGVNFKQGNPGQFSFVADKAFELEKRPAMQIQPGM
jgi:hypothetical protein